MKKFLTYANLNLREISMPTKNPRIHVVLERPLFANLKGLARKNGLSISLEARELIRGALRSAGKPSRKIYTGRHIKKLIGKFPMGKFDLDEVLVDQAHG